MINFSIVASVSTYGRAELTKISSSEGSVFPKTGIIARKLILVSCWVMWSEINILSLIVSERGLDVKIIELKFTKLIAQEHSQWQGRIW